MLIKIALPLGCLIFSTAAFAGTSDIMASNNQVSIQAVSTHVDYTETGNGLFGTQTGTLNTETGYIPGFALSSSSMSNLWLGTDYIKTEFDYSSGHTNYTGSFQDDMFGSVVATSRVKLINFSVRYGKGFIANEQLMLTPYTELGYHGWGRGVNYGETYTHYYFGLGMLGQYSPAGKLVFSANALLGNTFRSHITCNSGPGFNGFSGDLGNSTIYKAGVSADYAFMNNFHGNIGVDHTRFSYGMSAVYPVGGGVVAWEPDSKTKYTTIKVGLGYAL